MKRQMRKAVSMLLSAVMVTAAVPVQAGAEELIVSNDGIEVISSGTGDEGALAVGEGGLIGTDGVTGEGNEEILLETESETIEGADDGSPENLEPEMPEAGSDPAVALSDDGFVIEAVEVDEISEALALNAESEETKNYEGFNYRILEDGTVEITGYTGEQVGDLVIPNEIEGAVVSQIGEYAFSDCEGFDGSLVLPEGLTRIGEGAFEGCYGFIGDLNLPDGLLEIGDSAFYGCEGFTGNLVLSDGLANVSNYAFRDCYGFDGNLMLPDGITSIGKGAFQGCYGFDGNLTLPDSLIEIKARAFSGCSGFCGNLIFPDTLESIGDGAFLYCMGFTGELILPDSLIDLGENVFFDEISITAYGEEIYELEIRVGDQLQLKAKPYSNMNIPIDVLWESGNEDVVTVDESGLIMAVGIGENCTIYATTSSGLEASCNISVSESVTSESQGDSIWYIPGSIKLGYVFSEVYGESSGKKIVDIKNLTGNYVGKSITVTNSFSELDHLFTAAHAGNGSYLITDNEHIYGRASINYAVHPGTVTFQTIISGENIGEPYTVTIEEPEIATNEPSEVAVGECITLTSELQNTALTNEIVESYKKQIEEAKEQEKHLNYGWYDLGHNLVYEPEFVIEEGMELVECSNGDFTHTLTASEKIKFIGSGTVKIKIRYNPLPMCTLGGTYNYYYVPEKTITIQVKGKPEESEHTWNEGIVTKEATCTEDGEKTYTCTVCGATRTEAIAATGQHSYDTGKITTNASCTTAGEKTYTCTVCGATRTEAIAATGQHSYDAGKITTNASCTTAGEKTYTCTKCSQTKTEPVAAAGHKWGTWEKIQEATALAPALQRRTCSVCKETEPRNYGKQLKATVSFSASSLKLKKGQKTTAFKVTKMASGDYVKSVKSDNTKVLKVSKYTKTGAVTLEAQKKTGTAKLTIKLASGLEKIVMVKVQSGTVETTKISGLVKKMTLEKGKKATLSPVITPITSLQKISYKTSNKKVATVSGKGVITAKSAGTARITVQSGKKKVTVTVTVPKVKTIAIKNVPAKKTLKVGKSYTIKAKLVPAGSGDKITYSSSNKKVVTVNSKGKITGKKKGKAVITVKSGKIAVSCTVTVK